MNQTTLPFDIAVVGLGINGVHQLTREGDETLRRCKQIFLLAPSPGVATHLGGSNSTVIDLADRFRPGVHRGEIYRGIASEIVAAAVESPPVGFATYGHPKMLSYPTVLVQRAAAILDLRVWVLPGISFLDTLLADLGIDPGFDGLQLYEASDLLVRARPLQNDVACVIAQAPMVGDAETNDASVNPNLSQLQDYLLRFYPPDHRVVVVVSSPHPVLEPLRQTTTVSQLASIVGSSPRSGTLYIPPVERRKVADELLAQRLRGAPSRS